MSIRPNADVIHIEGSRFHHLFFGDDHGFAFLNQFEEPGKLGGAFVLHIHCAETAICDTTNAAAVATTNGQSIQFRWRLGTDSSVVGTNYGGLSVDDVTITNLKQTVVCEPTRNPGLPSCPGGCASAPDGTGCDDGNACTQTDSCQSGVCVGANPVVCSPLDQCHDAGTCTLGVCSNPNKTNGSACNDASGCTINDVCTGGTCGGTPITAPGEAGSVAASSDKITYTWSTVAGATRYDVVRGSLSAFPVGPGGADESCFDDLASARGEFVVFRRG
jgi:hypothetical protein